MINKLNNILYEEISKHFEILDIIDPVEEGHRLFSKELLKYLKELKNDRN